MINVVLETRRGNPISLCVIYMLVAQKMKLPVYGVNLPNMFILTYKSEHNQFYINVFNKGVLLTKSDIDNYISSLKLEPSDVFYEPCSHIDIVRRVLRNLMVAFEKSSEVEKMEEIKILLNDISDNENANY
jgi:regulator of sirC expression with transglutaminase-like and TPR domain